MIVFLILLALWTPHISGMENSDSDQKKFRVFFIENNFDFKLKIVVADANGLNLTDHIWAEKKMELFKDFLFLAPASEAELIILDPSDEPIEINFPLTLKVWANIGYRPLIATREIKQAEHGHTFVLDPFDPVKKIKEIRHALDEWFSENIERDANCHIQ